MPPQKYKLTNRDINVLIALKILLLFDYKRSKMHLRDILKESKGDYIPAIIKNLQFLESRKLLARKTSSGRIFWQITSFGCRIREKITAILDSIDGALNL